MPVSRKWFYRPSAEAMRAAHESDPEECCSVSPTATSDMLLDDEKLQPELCPLLGVVFGINAPAVVTSLALSSLDGVACGVKVKAGVADDSEPVVISASNRSLSRLIVSST